MVSYIMTAILIGQSPDSYSELKRAKPGKG